MKPNIFMYNNTISNGQQKLILVSIEVYIHDIMLLYIIKKYDRETILKINRKLPTHQNRCAGLALHLSIFFSCNGVNGEKASLIEAKMIRSELLHFEQKLSCPPKWFISIPSCAMPRIDFPIFQRKFRVGVSPFERKFFISSS